MRNPGGQVTLVGPDRPGPNAAFVTQQCDSYTCGHCQRIVEVPVRADPANVGGMCKQCMSLICPACVDKRVCMPWEKQMIESENRYHARRSYGL